MFYIVGSGPSGISAAEALLDAGREVTLLDIGRTCPPDRKAVIDTLSGIPFDSWPKELLAPLVQKAPPSSHFPKLAFGSNFPYATPVESELEQSGTACVLSVARGGLSNVWGAAVLPNRPDDFSDWPVRHEEMVPYYQAAAARLGIAGVDDDLAHLFPIHHAWAPPMRLSQQASGLLTHMTHHRERLRRGGFTFGRSRLAVRTSSHDGAHGCQNIGLCLTGCPFRAIWNAGEVIPELQRRGMRYLPGVQVLDFQAGRHGIRLLGRDLSTGTPMQWDGDRALLACGPLETARIVATGLRAFGEDFSLQYQPYFLLPMVARSAFERVRQERLHTLAQIFVELDNRLVSKEPVHLQFYSYNSFFEERVQSLTRLVPFREAIREATLGRLLAVQGYLHSAEADPIRVRCVPRAAGRTRLVLTAGSSTHPSRTIRRVLSHLRSHASALGAYPLGFLLRRGRPGEGNHVGGTFPMRDRPSKFETDALGALPGVPRLHLVDSSVLPSLPPSTFTFTVMANARRIAHTLGGGLGAS